MRLSLLLCLTLLMSAQLTACKYQRPAQEDVAEKAVLLDNEGNPLQQSGAATQAAPTEQPGEVEVPAVVDEPAQLVPDAPVKPGEEAPADVAAIPADATKTASGLGFKVLAAGTGSERPGPNDVVKAKYKGWTTDGKLFDSSGDNAIEFSLGQVIPGWTEGLQLMTNGERRRFWIPENLAYAGRPGMPAGMLVFDVELVEFRKAPQTPEDLTQPPADAEKAENGLLSKVLSPGTGTAKPKPDDFVRVHFSGWTSDGKLFDSTKLRGEAVSLPLNKLPEGWSQGIQLMVQGESRRIWVPEELAFKGRPGAPTGTLVFDVELLEIVSQPEAPADVAAPPAEAEKTASGLASKVLVPGTGSVKPKATSTVEVHYSGWTTDGKLFDSSRTRGKTAVFALTDVIPGWTEGLQLMVEGEQRRLWIPTELAYAGRPGKPQGMLVFDVELVKIVSE
ncbi:MAG: FKBP-type peptidyl-prolyl cis-trans isomerase [Myxococcota bacterium]|jgi:peptidylprolyl isomerase|nr:FKBP-type peptidyl-prolyl cis-trans isomerase [Myxococcota bacterium]